tara:strand:- start:7693 stop:7866 length:174 start_codon:yes stop_codon:yes gene_type:complete
MGESWPDTAKTATTHPAAKVTATPLRTDPGAAYVEVRRDVGANKGAFSPTWVFILLG